MSLLNSMNKTARTANGALTLKSSMSACVDFFFLAGASRGKDISTVFTRAYAEDAEVATRLLLWLRDVRGGAGERKQFRDLVTQLPVSQAAKVLDKIPELGRWDDLFVFVGTKLEDAAFSRIQDALEEKNGLCAKWMPRKGANALKLRKFLDYSPKHYRKTLVELSETVEQRMCAGAWGAIEYGHVPSVAAARYQRAFGKHDEVGYAKYRDSLVKGEAKINAGAVYPHDVLFSLNHGDAAVANAQWAALPNYMEESAERILPMVDVSGSMGRLSYSERNTPINIAIALGLYISERNEGVFKDQIFTFSSTPELVKVTGTLEQRAKSLSQASWCMSTNFNKAFRTILDVARRDRLTEEQMPTKVLVLSDMEFDASENYFSGWVAREAGEKTNFEAVDAMYAEYGYTRPQIVFWNLNGRQGNSPVTVGQAGTALVSGFSPSIMTSLLGGEDFSPESIMLATALKDRYSF